jgi:Ca-activated chloride channel family protein
MNKKRTGVIIHSNLKLLKELSKNRSKKFKYIPGILRILAVTLIILALAKPKLLGNKKDLEVKGIDIVFVLDISTSMAAADFIPKDRLNVAKEVIKDFVDSRKNDRIGLVVFNALSYVQAPLTLDHKIFTTLLKAINMDEIRNKVTNGLLQDGTAIGNAIGTAVNRLKDGDTKSKIIILLTDGSNNKGNMTPEKASELAKKTDIKVYPILVGKQGRVPYPSGVNLYGNTQYNYVDNSVNPELLKNISKITNSKFYMAQNREELRNDLTDIIDHFEKSKFQEQNFDNLETYYFPFVSLAFLLLIIEFILTTTIYKKLS